ncbi:hypothetical protein O9G_003681 [Rozella allomycis CSF55]|uniref:Uncharacterized protein n=1 Tax=Rozella allomycis (strain CSF55) TaxID=988480 RepID=A0A075AYR9_ROZAC|nr:hypothetical protein O9G_003681 [Rozella allomycis CSF55]|eukprot:EPZ35422.1 hypothetical protein O9G_003681 [Rozella allomycis CSF55]
MTNSLLYISNWSLGSSNDIEPGQDPMFFKLNFTFIGLSIKTILVSVMILGAPHSPSTSKDSENFSHFNKYLTEYFNTSFGIKIIANGKDWPVVIIVQLYLSFGFFLVNGDVIIVFLQQEKSLMLMAGMPIC